ncbi:MAG: endonuclease/exonuclease/phosphatase family protein [Streptosporangiaceae bacterium]|jgi:exonuclease III
MTTNRQLPLITPPGPAHNAATGTIRLMLFNAQHAAPGRARRQAAWIAAQQDADLVVITEVGAGPGGQALIEALGEHGYSPVLASETAAPDYRAILGSRGPALTPIPTEIGVLAHRGPAAAVAVGGHTVGLLGLYVPSRGPKRRRNENKRAFQDAVATALPGFLAQFSGSAIVAGDLNVVEPGHQPHLPVFGAWEYAFYRSFGDAGMIDAYRASHPDTSEHSWFGRSGNGYRIDHIFVSRQHEAQVRCCRYLQAPRQLGLTDHAAMTLTLAPAPTITDAALVSVHQWYHQQEVGKPRKR